MGIAAREVDAVGEQLRQRPVGVLRRHLEVKGYPRHDAPETPHSEMGRPEGVRERWRCDGQSADQSCDRQTDAAQRHPGPRSPRGQCPERLHGGPSLPLRRAAGGIRGGTVGGRAVSSGGALGRMPVADSPGVVTLQVPARTAATVARPGDPNSTARWNPDRPWRDPGADGSLVRPAIASPCPRPCSPKSNRSPSGLRAPGHLGGAQ